MAPWDDVSYPRALAVALAVVLGATLLYGGLTSSTAFGAYNPTWDGVSELRSLSDGADGETVVVRNASSYDGHGGSDAISFVLSPDEPYGASESTHVERFVRAGGTLVVAEDFSGNSNGLLADVGADARFDGRLLRDERQYGDSPDFPTAGNVSTHNYTAGVEELVLNRGTAVEPNGAEVLVNTSEFAYLDGNLNGELDDSETLRQRPVVTVERVGDGRVVAVGDPSLFINAMLERDGNRQFVEHLVSAHGVRLVDTSHLSSLPPLVTVQLALRDSTALQIGLGFGLVFAVCYWRLARSLIAGVRRRFGREPSIDPELDREAVDQWIRSRHPEWERRDIDRVTKEIMRRKENEHSND